MDTGEHLVRQQGTEALDFSVMSKAGTSCHLAACPPHFCPGPPGRHALTSSFSCSCSLACRSPGSGDPSCPCTGDSCSSTGKLHRCFLCRPWAFLHDCVILCCSREKNGLTFKPLLCFPEQTPAFKSHQKQNDDPEKDTSVRLPFCTPRELVE